MANCIHNSIFTPHLKFYSDQHWRSDVKQPVLKCLFVSHGGTFEFCRVPMKTNA